MKGLISCIALSFILLGNGWSQTIANSSFEGPRGPSRTPPGWDPCGQGSSPDTQPGCWQVIHPAYEGGSYLSMICRGSNVPFPNQSERCGQQLDQPLRARQCYLMRVSLARSNNFYAGAIYFNRPAIFRIWGSTSLCGKEELLWQSPLISNPAWQDYEFAIMSGKDVQFLLIETAYAGADTYSGNILVDKLQIIPDVDPCEPMSMRPVFPQPNCH